MSSPLLGQTPGDPLGENRCDNAHVVPLTLIKTGVAYIILYSTLSTLLFVLLCAVLMKNGLGSSRTRAPVVWLLGFSMLLGVLGSVLDTVFWATQMLKTVTAAKETASYYIASNAMLFIVPWVVRWAMCLRIASFYPESLAARKKRIAVVIFPTCMQIINLITFCVVLQDGYRTVRAAGGSLATGLTNYRLMLDLMSYSAVLLSSIYYNIFLLRKFRILGGPRTSAGALGSPSSLASRRETVWWHNLKQVIYALSFSYVVPTMYDIALIVVFCTIQGKTLGFMLVINVYVHVFAGTLACLSTAGKWRDKENHFYPTHAEGERALSDLATATGIDGNGSGRLRNFHHRSQAASSSGSPGDSSQGKDISHEKALAYAGQEGYTPTGLAIPESLHRVTTVGGHAMVPLPPSMPVSESKLLLHQRRRVSLAVPSMKEDDGHYVSNSSPDLWARRVTMERDAVRASMMAPPAHIDLPPSAIPVSGAGSPQSQQSPRRRTKDAQAASPIKKGYTIALGVSPAKQQDNDLSPRSLDPNIDATPTPSSHPPAPVPERSTPAMALAKDADLEDAADSKAALDADVQPSLLDDDAYAILQEELLQRDEDVEDPRSTSRAEERRSSEATLLNPAPSMGDLR